MSVDGIWLFEVAGIFGWERISTVFLERGRYLGGGPFIFSKGTYEVNGKTMTIKLDVTQHGEKQAIFGQKQKHFSTETIAKIKGKKIEGNARLKGAKSTIAEYPIRLTRLDDLPDCPK